MQDPHARPTAKDLQQHPFVSKARADAAAALQPLIEKSRALAAALSADLEGPPKLPPGVR